MKKLQFTFFKTLLVLLTLDKHESIFVQVLRFSQRQEELGQGAMMTRTGHAENKKIVLLTPKKKRKKQARCS